MSVLCLFSNIITNTNEPYIDFIQIVEEEYRLEEIGVQDQNNLRIYPIGYRDNNLLNINFLIEFHDGFKLPASGIIDIGVVEVISQKKNSSQRI